MYYGGLACDTYIPMILRKRAIADPVGCSLGGDIPWPENAPWIQPMRKGFAHLRHEERVQRAHEVALGGPWDAKSISQLAGMFCEHAVEDFGSIPCNNALFARQVYLRFWEMGYSAASLFQNQLMQAVLAEFKALWMPVSSAPSPRVCHAHSSLVSEYVIVNP